MIGKWAPRQALRVALLGAVLMGGGAARAVQPLLVLGQKVTASDGIHDDEFGYAVAIEGDTAIVGGTASAADRGAAYVFRRTVTGWTEVAQLTADDTRTGEHFGSAVALSGDTAVIGRAWSHDSGPFSGSAYVFQRSGGTWAQVAKLTAADAAANDYFGASVSISGDTAIVGSVGDDDGATNSGSAYVFQRTGGIWTQVAKLTAADAAAEDWFGFRVSVVGDTAIIGAIYDDDGGFGSGSAYIFQRSGGTWAQAAKLTAADTAAGDCFGSAVSLDGDTAIIGASGDNDDGLDSGSAYIFQRTGGTWVQAAKLTASDAAADAWFGCAVSISGNLATIGAWGDSVYTGSAYVFQRSGTTWAQVAKMGPSDRATPVMFGRAVAVSGDTVLVGAFSENEPGSAPGSAYFFHLLPPTADDVAAADGEGADEFGGAVAISGSYAVVGAAREDAEGHDAGAAYAYRHLATGWTEEDKLIAADAASSDHFGWSVAVDGTTAVVGAPGKSLSMGAAYIFQRNKFGVWAQTKKLVGSDGAAGHTFGSAVAIDGDVVLVGAPSAPGSVVGAGAVYLFERDHGGSGNWGQAQKATASDGAASDGFGTAVTIRGEVALFGAPQELRARPNPGAVYVFELDPPMSKWGQTAKLIAADGANADLFGGALGFDGSTAVVGARGHDAHGTDAGAAYVFGRNGLGGWDAGGELHAFDAAAADAFGRAVAVAGDLIVVGADGDDDLGSLSGSTYVFRRTADPAAPWVGKLLAEHGTAGDRFGWAVALDTGTALVGAPFAEPGRADTGTATFCELQPAAPRVTAITRYDPSAAPTTAATVTFLVTFDHAVSNVQAGNFALTTSGGQVGATLGALSAASGTALTVAVTTVPGQSTGTIRLDLPTPAGITDSWLTPMTASYTAGATYTIDRIPPAAPVVSGPASPTDQRCPTWTWAPGGGNGTFRHRLDDPNLASGATETTATAWTPTTDLGDGWHALYVQERDDAGNWSAAGSFAVYVGRPVLTVTADNAERLYGDPNPAFTVQISGFVGDGDIADLTTLPTATSVATPGSPVGKVDIIPAGGADETYTFAYVNGTLTVGPAPLTCTADDKNRAYGDANPALTSSYTGLRNGDTAPATPPSAACSAGLTSPVGAYAITLSGGSDPNYTLTRVAGVLTVGKRTLTVTAQDATRPYGDANPALTVGYVGFANGDDPEDLDSRPRATCVASATSSPGAYPIVPAGGVAGNYDFAYVNGTLTVEPAPVTCTADDQSRLYGDSNPALTVSYTGLRNGAANPVGRPVAMCIAHALSPPGAYPITLSGGGDPNYTLTLVPGTLTVGKRPLTVTADSGARYYGDPNPAFTVQISGFVWDEAIGDLTTLPTAACTATPASPSGAYDIVPTGGFDDLYDFAYVNGTLTVGPTPLTCTADDRSRPYGDDNPALTVGYVGLRNGEPAPATPPSAACSAERASPVGAYPITLSGGADPNYTLTLVPGTLTVAPAPLTCRADDQSRSYGQATPPLTITYMGLRNADLAPAVPPVAACAALALSPVGAYPITLGGGSDPNYALALVPGTLTVDKADQTIAFAALAERTYGDAPFELTATATSGLPVYFGSSDTDVAALSAGRGWTANIVGAGASTIDAFQNGDGNWNAAPPLPRTLTVQRAALSITAAAAIRRLGQPNPVFTASAAGLQNGDTLAGIGLAVSYACAADEFSPPGAYPVTPSGDGTTTDYSVAYVAGTLTVTDKEIPVITWPVPAAITYGTALGAAQLNATANTPGSFVYTPSAGTVLNAGSRLLAVAFTPDDGGNYAATGATVQLLVEPARLTVTAQSATRTYGDTNPAFTVGYTGFVNGDAAADLDSPSTATCAATPASAAGGYSIVPAGGADNNYAFGYVDGTLTVAPAPLTCRADDQSRSYGQTNPALTIGYTGLKNADSAPAVPPSAACAALALSPVGAYPITLSGGSDPNYALALVPGTLTVDKADQTIAFAALAERTYGAAAVELVATATSGLPVYFGSSDTDVAALSAGRGWTANIVGAGATTISAFQNGDGNWNAAPPLPRTLTVQRAALSITAAAAIRRLGQPNPVFAADATGLQNGDTLAGISLAVSYACAADEFSPPGAYPVTPSGDGTTTDYTVTYVAGTLTVTDKEIPVITWPVPAAITYGTALGAAQLNATANTPGSFVYTPSAGTVLEAGSRLLAVAFTPDDLAHWLAASATMNIELRKADQAVAFANPGDKVCTDSFVLGATGGGSASPVIFLVTAGPAVIGAGNQLSFTGVGEVTITATQAGDANWNAAPDVSRTFSVARAIPAIVWATPAPIEYGTRLGETQLDATANTAGTFAYTPAAGTLLARGTHTLALVFSPADPAHWADAAAEQTIEVVDTTAPAVTSVLPLDGTVNVAHSAALVLTFSEAVMAGRGAIRIMNADGSLFESLAVPGRGTVSIAGETVTTEHAPFVAGSSYHVLIDGTCFQDMAGNAFSGIADPATWRFIARPWVVAFGAGAHGVLLGPSVQTVNDSAAAVAPGVQAAAGWAFTGWDTDIAHVRADLTVTAQYGRQTYAVSFLAGAGGSISGRAAQTVGHDGSTEPVTAEPDFGHVFVQWDDDSTANPRTLHHVTTATTRVASFRQAGAVPPRGTFLAQVDAAGVAAGHGLWDLTGPYAASVAGNLLTLNLLHDANGKLSGTASLQVNTGKAQVPVAMSIRGSTKGSGGALLVSLALQGANVAGAVSVSLALELTLNTAANQLSGPVAGSLTRGGVTTPVSQPQPIVLDIPAPMDGTWTLSLDLAQAPRTLSGTARLTLRNGVAHLYTLRGRPSGAAVLVALSADPSDPAARGTDVRATLETLEGGWARLQGLSGKAYGQTLIW